MPQPPASAKFNPQPWPETRLNLVPQSFTSMSAAAPQYSAVECTRAKVAVGSLLLQHPGRSQQAASRPVCFRNNNMSHIFHDCSVSVQFTLT